MERTFLRASPAANTRVAIPKRDPFPPEFLLAGRHRSGSLFSLSINAYSFCGPHACDCLVEYCFDLPV